MPKTEAKVAVRLAKEHVSDLFGDEQIEDLGLEEVRFDHETNTWEITVGFARPWQRGGSQRYPFDEQGNLVRSYKVVDVADQGGDVVRVRDRFLVDSFLTTPG